MAVKLIDKSYVQAQFLMNRLWISISRLQRLVDSRAPASMVRLELSNLEQIVSDLDRIYSKIII